MKKLPQETIEDLLNYLIKRIRFQSNYLDILNKHYEILKQEHPDCELCNQFSELLGENQWLLEDYKVELHNLRMGYDG